MIAQSLVTEVRRLLGEGKLSQRAISRTTGVSRGTVSAIASGKRPDYVPRDNELCFDDPVGPPERCSTCGGMVYMPCRLCEIRRRIAKMSEDETVHRAESSKGASRLDLHDAESIRYEQVRSKRARERRFMFRRSAVLT